RGALRTGRAGLVIWAVVLARLGFLRAGLHRLRRDVLLLGGGGRDLAGHGLRLLLRGRGIGIAEKEVADHAQAEGHNNPKHDPRGGGIALLTAPTCRTLGRRPCSTRRTGLARPSGGTLAWRDGRALPGHHLAEFGVGIPSCRGASVSGEHIRVGGGVGSGDGGRAWGRSPG